MKRTSQRKKKGLLLALSMAAFSIGMSGCGKDKAGETAYEQISQEEAKLLMDTEEKVTVLDVRTEEEYASGHIKGAVCIPNETIEDEIEKKLPDKNQLILVYCRSGNRSKQASEKLSALGYTRVKEFGGIHTWPYETE